MLVRDVMTEKVCTIWPEATLREAEAYLAGYAVSGLPVLDEERRLVGVVSESDVVRAIAAASRSGGAGPGAARTVADVMTRQPLAVVPELPLVRAAALMSEHDVNRLPVVVGRRLVGIVSRADVVRGFAAPDEEVVGRVHALLDELPLDGDVVEVDVHGGRVTLRGELETRRLAEHVAARVGQVVGVRTIDPQLEWRRDDAVALARRRDGRAS